MLSKFILFLIPVIGFAKLEAISEGTTYPIAEPNMLTEIQQKSSTINWDQVQQKYKLANTINILPIAREDRVFKFTPTTTLPFEVKDEKGKVIYPKGFQFNPLKYTSLPYKLIVIGSIKQFQNIKNKINDSDIIMVSNIDPRYFIKQTGYRAFILTKDAISRLGIKKVPSIVTQVNTQFLVHEYGVSNND